MRSPKHKLTRSGRGWFKRIGREVKWICSINKAPSGEEADAVFEAKFTELCQPARSSAGAGQISNVALVGTMFLDRKADECEAGQLDARTYHDYDESVRRFSRIIGGDTLISDLTPLKFSRFSADIAKLGVHRRAKHTINIRTMFNWSAAMRLIKDQPDYGPDFRSPSRSDFRKARAKREADNGKLLYSPDDIRKLLAWPHTWNMRAMILLALNAGFGNTDLAELRWPVIDLDNARIDYTRGKTGIRREALLWPETVAALRTVKYPAHFNGKPPEDGTVFVTRQGQRLIGEGRKDATGVNFYKLCENCGVASHGFYSLRRTFRTVADSTGDTRAIARIMGHEIGDVADIYVQDITPLRLSRVSEFVREALRIADALAASSVSDQAARAARSDAAKAWRRRSRSRSSRAGTAGKKGKPSAR